MAYTRLQVRTGPYVVTQGLRNFVLWQSLLEADFRVSDSKDSLGYLLPEQVAIAHSALSGWAGAHYLARSLQLKRFAPIALIVNAESDDAGERRVLLENSLSQQADRETFLVMVIAPTIERLLIEPDINILERIIKRTLSETERQRARNAPQRYLIEQVVGVAHGFDAYMADLYRRNKAVLRELRRTDEYLRLREFLETFTDV
ncbi:MAG: hypothetical protein SFU56_12350 [Capsulimonadales bacterium]|nr:hypothetical protein [Capsulimonadales bacterium]